MTTNVGGVYICIFWLSLLTPYQVALFICPGVPEARASGRAGANCGSAAMPRYTLTWRDRARQDRLLGVRAEGQSEKGRCCKIVLVWPCVEWDRGWKDKFYTRGALCHEEKHCATSKKSLKCPDLACGLSCPDKVAAKQVHLSG